LTLSASRPTTRSPSIPADYNPFGGPVTAHAANGRQADLWAPVPPNGGRPEWCGRCDERTRMRDLDDGRVARCTACNPNAVAVPGPHVIPGEVVSS
jgi:hypothetical protein